MSNQFFPSTLPYSYSLKARAVQNDIIHRSEGKDDEHLVFVELSVFFSPLMMWKTDEKKENAQVCKC